MKKILLHQFEEKLELLGYSKRSVADYSRVVGHFMEYLETQESISDFNEVGVEHLDSYHSFLQFCPAIKGKILTTQSVCYILGAIKAFFRVMKQEGLISNDLSEHIRLPLVRKRIPRNVPSIDDVQRILEAAEPLDILSIRDRAILEFLYATAIRSEELQTLRLRDYDVSEHTVFIRGKGDQDRIVPVGIWVEPYVNAYLEKSRPELVGKREIDLLFVSYRGKKLSRNSLWHLVRRYAQKASVKHVMPHGFRHACATHLLHNGADIRIVQELLGHRSLNSTQIYTKVDIHLLQQAHTRFHPRERW